MDFHSLGIVVHGEFLWLRVVSPALTQGGLPLFIYGSSLLFLFGVDAGIIWIKMIQIVFYTNIFIFV